MAEIQDLSDFKIKITPEYSNWWSYRIDFFFKDKPLFNPDVFKNGEAKADEYSSWALLPILEKALECTTPGEILAWGEWEDEAAITITYQKPNSLAEDGFFIFSASVSAYFFKEGDGNTMDHPAGLSLHVMEREQLRNFYQALNNEMWSIYEKLPEDHKGEGAGSVPKQIDK